MVGTPATTPAMRDPAAVRAGFWGRALALSLDLLIVNLLVAVAGLALTGWTDGHVRVAGTVLNMIECTARGPVPPGIVVPPDLAAAEARRCTRSVLGMPHDWKLVLSEKLKAGEDPKDVRQVTLATDREGRPARVFYLDDMIPFLLAGWLLLFEWRAGGTPGKRLVGIQVRSLDGGPVRFVQASQRLLTRLVVLVAIWSDDSFVEPATESSRSFLKLLGSHGTVDLGAWFDVVRLLALAYVVSVALTIHWQTRPFHDRWARTDAVRTAAR